MSLAEIVLRSSVVVKKYEKYAAQRERARLGPDADAFDVLWDAIDAELDMLEEKVNTASSEHNRAMIATLNAEIRRGRAAVRDEMPKLEKLVKKKAKTPEVKELTARLEAIPDGVTVVVPEKKKKKKKGEAVELGEIKIDNSDYEDKLASNPEYYTSTDETDAYRAQFQKRKAKQDESLDVISAGLSTLKNMGEDMNEELDKQEILIENMEKKIDTASTEIKSQNNKIKGLITNVRSTRNFCIDVTLIILLLAIGFYIYK
eukprot:jgi/Chlat1/1380/Chrsp119S08662